MALPATFHVAINHLWNISWIEAALKMDFYKKYLIDIKFKLMWEGGGEWREAIVQMW